MSIKDLLNELANMSAEEKAQLMELLKSSEEDQPTPKKKVGRRGKKEFRNKFEESPLFHSHKEDIKKDKLLWGDNQPEPRRKAAKLVKIKCMSCQTECEVDPSLVFVMGKNEYSFKCEKCISGRKRR